MLSAQAHADRNWIIWLVEPDRYSLYFEEHAISLWYSEGSLPPNMGKSPNYFEHSVTASFAVCVISMTCVGCGGVVDRGMFETVLK